MADLKYLPEQLVAPDDVDPKKLRPFDAGEVLDNQDGTHSTERTATFNIGGKEVLVPTLWMSDKGPVDLSRYPQTIVRAVQEFEARTKKAFPRFDTPDAADEFARGRTHRGGIAGGALAN